MRENQRRREYGDPGCLLPQAAVRQPYTEQVKPKAGGTTPNDKGNDLHRAPFAAPLISPMGHPAPNVRATYPYLAWSGALGGYVPGLPPRAASPCASAVFTRHLRASPPDWP